jgi:tetratricopeptide (TPR) repeat protein
LSNLAEALKSQGDLNAAQALHEKVLEIRNRTLGEEHHDTLASMNNLAETLKSQGDLNRAQALLKKVLEIRKAHSRRRAP